MKPIPDELSIDSSHVKAHVQRAAQKEEVEEAIGRSRRRKDEAKFMLWPTIAADRSLSR